ncbi:UNVERIFIED_CONTAM: hypothetical protein HDU68_000650, partial [Siphonaria sp. JEL0065]
TRITTTYLFEIILNKCWITKSTKTLNRIGLLPSPADLSQQHLIQHSLSTLYTLFKSTRVHPDRFIYALAGTLFDWRSPQPFGGSKMKPGFLNYTGTNTTDLLHFIITEAYMAYWNNMNVKGIKFVVVSINQILDLHHHGVKDTTDELLLKGMKKAGHIEWFGPANVPYFMRHIEEDGVLPSGISFTFPSKLLKEYIPTHSRTLLDPSLDCHPEGKKRLSGSRE